MTVRTTKLTFVVDVTVSHETELPQELVRETIRYHLGLLPQVTTLGISLDGDTDPKKKEPMGDITATEPHTAAECNRCSFYGCTCLDSRDQLKIQVHQHIRETGHSVRWADGATLTHAPVEVSHGGRDQ